MNNFRSHNSRVLKFYTIKCLVNNRYSTYSIVLMDPETPGFEFFEYLWYIIFIRILNTNFNGIKVCFKNYIIPPRM